MQTHQALQHAQRRPWMASAVLALVLVSLLAAAVQPEAHQTRAQPVSAQVPDAASQTPAPTTVKNIVQHKTETHRQYALQQATPIGENVLS